MKRGLRFFDYLAMVLVVAVVAAFFLPTSSSKEASPRTHCMSRLKQLATGSLIYAADWQEKFPGEGWHEALGSTGLKGTNVFSCFDADAHGRVGGYALHSEMAGKDSSRVGKPEEEILFFEIDAWSFNVIANLAARNGSRHQGKSIVAYADSHFSVLDEEFKR